ncbi:sodium channel protein Nach-like [Euwallacea fornicatus]|uniref:sodium channel protein Nach-like n=1 Tax=Euwallacea fornicatus TaxID=995702 RepID=UPI0033905324
MNQCLTLKMAKRGSFLKRALVSTREVWLEFCLKTSLHGWKFTVSRSVAKAERLTWLMICIISVTSSLLPIYLVWKFSIINPTKTVAASLQHDIYLVKFPAVTVCSNNIVSKRAAYVMARKLLQLRVFREGKNKSNVDVVANNLGLLANFVLIRTSSIREGDYKGLKNVIKGSGLSEVEIFNQITPNCEEILQICMWKGDIKPCKNLFYSIKTPIGNCCTFNYVAYPKNIINGSEKTAQITTSCGYQSGLEVLVKNYLNDTLPGFAPSPEYRVIVHSPYDFPNRGLQSVLCNPGTNNMIGVNAAYIQPTTSLLSLDASTRKCLISDEKPLGYFSVYTYRNCVVECEIAIIFEVCGCAPFFAKSEFGPYNSAKGCTLDDIKCMQSAYASRDKLVKKFGNLVIQEKCNCLPECEIFSYKPEFSYGILDKEFCATAFILHTDFDVKNSTIIRVFLNDLTSTLYRKDANYPPQIFAGYCGSTFSFFGGFSIISLVEIVYLQAVHVIRWCKSNKK